MIELDNRTSLKISTETVDAVAKFLTKKDVELIITNNKEMREINAAHRNLDKDTDVLSFPYEEMPMSPLGSIVISDSHVKNMAKKLNHSENDEFSLLFIHGLLHLLGFDHETDNGEMRDKEAELIKKFNLPLSLIIRTEGK